PFASSHSLSVFKSMAWVFGWIPVAFGSIPLAESKVEVASPCLFAIALTKATRQMLLLLFPPSRTRHHLTRAKPFPRIPHLLEIERSLIECRDAHLFACFSTIRRTSQIHPRRREFSRPRISRRGR